MGVEFAATWDSRVLELHPREGILVDVRPALCPQHLGTEARFSQSECDPRVYGEPLPDLLIAFQGLSLLSSGTVPFQSLAELGGAHVLRGFPHGRFRDRDSFAVQSEIRFPLFWRFRGARFGAVGQVTSSPDEVDLSSLSASAGVGVRLTLQREGGANLRLDVGFSREGTGVCIGMLEAF